MTKAVTSTEGRDLIVTRVIDAPPEKYSGLGLNLSC
jgi:hypothetical protein